MANLDINKIKSDYYVFDGKIGKKEYTTKFLILFVAGFVAGFLIGFVGGLVGLGQVAYLLLLIVYAIVIPAHFSIAIRRLNDLGHPAIFSILLLVPLVNIALVIYLCITDPENAIGKDKPVI